MAIWNPWDLTPIVDLVIGSCNRDRTDQCLHQYVGGLKATESRFEKSTGQIDILIAIVNGLLEVCLRRYNFLKSNRTGLKWKRFIIGAWETNLNKHENKIHLFQVWWKGHDLIAHHYSPTSYLQHTMRTSGVQRLCHPKKPFCVRERWQRSVVLQFGDSVW